MLEIELKACLDDETARHLETKLEDHFLFQQARQEIDRYFQAPDRDFKKTDEALRIREVDMGDTRSFLTYKGPKTDVLSNTRLELETPVEDAGTLGRILDALGYRAVLTVRKRRREYRGTGDFEKITLCLDQVEGLGHFIELEYMAPDDLSDRQRENIRDWLLALLEDLGVDPVNLRRESYLELLIQRATS